MEWLKLEEWSPYIIGAGIGILSWFAFLFSDHPIGCSTAFARTSGMIERLFRGGKVEEKPYYQKFKPTIDWQWMLVLGVIIGAFISSRLSGYFQPRWVPEIPSDMSNDLNRVFVTIPYARILMAFVGGILMGIGSRWAGGCTSGHGISGTLQLAVSSWIAAICFFVGGIAVAMLIFRVFTG
ncbi:YeeE/YedE family protein [Candidatus Poribacteria bacterium]|nr:YeeE/YedE family protein [Candidatus Poribacteria bacterium]